MKDDLIGRAILDFHTQNNPENITTYSSLDEKDVLPTDYLFRSYKEMPKLEKQALKQCSGKVLDIGCGAGSHSLYLQNKGFNVTGLDSSAGAIKVCKNRGLTKVVHRSILDYAEDTFDTLLLLMNGIGLAQSLEELPKFLLHLRSLLNNKGQILLDSSDIIYMFDKDEDGGYWVPNNNKYYGEVVFTMKYKGMVSSDLPWLYLDYDLLHDYASKAGFQCDLLGKGPHFDYLARLQLANTIPL